MNLDQLNTLKKQLEYYRLQADKTLLLLTEEQLNWSFNQTSNSIAVLMRHLSGNMKSRWTDFLEADGEKESRDRDSEFARGYYDRHQLISEWNDAWDLLFNTLDALDEAALQGKVRIRNQEHTVFDAIVRQSAHYPYHIGQLVFIGKMLLNDHWQSLTIPMGQSKTYNQLKFSQPNSNTHFTDDYLKKQ